MSLMIFDIDEFFIMILFILYIVSEFVIGVKNVGDIVNIECDMIGKYIECFIIKFIKWVGLMIESFL